MGNPILSRAPLILVIAEIHFSPILLISQKIAEIQECLRHNGFPEFTITQEESYLQKTEGELTSRWQFASKNNQSAIIISNDTLTFETSQYSKFDSFTKTFEQAIELFSTIANPDLLKSVNLRYVDLIQNIDGQKAEQLIKPKFIQLENISISQSHYQYESVQFETQEGIVRINLIKSCEDLIVPPDIEPVVSIPDKKTEEDIILDISHIAIFEETDFSVAKIMHSLHQMHDKNVNPAFRSIVTPSAYEKWKQGEET